MGLWAVQDAPLPHHSHSDRWRKTPAPWPRKEMRVKEMDKWMNGWMGNRCMTNDYSHIFLLKSVQEILASRQASFLRQVLHSMPTPLHLKPCPSSEWTDWVWAWGAAGFEGRRVEKLDCDTDFISRLFSWDFFDSKIWRLLSKCYSLISWNRWKPLAGVKLNLTERSNHSSGKTSVLPASPSSTIIYLFSYNEVWNW